MSYYFHVPQWQYIDVQEREIQPERENRDQARSGGSSQQEESSSQPIISTDTLEQLVPATLRGLSLKEVEAGTRTLRSDTVYPEVWATCESAENGGDSTSGPLRKTDLYTAYGAITQLIGRGELAEERHVRKLEAHGETVYLAGTETDGPAFGALFPGGSALFFRAQFEADTGEAEREEVALAVIEESDISPNTALETTAGFRYYQARMVGFARNPIESVRLLQNQSSFSLPVSDSGYVTVAFLGGEISPEEYAEEALGGGAGLTIEQKIEDPEQHLGLSMAGTTEMTEIVALAEDSAGREVDYHLLLAELEHGLIAVSVMSPHSGAPISTQTVETMLSSLSLTARQHVCPLRSEAGQLSLRLARR